MQHSLSNVTFLLGDESVVECISSVPAKVPFQDETIVFLDDLSKSIMTSKEAKLFPDVITFGFWIRKASLLSLKTKYNRADQIRYGKGVVFHIAPSNVPVIFAYSLVSGLLTGNANVVRVPSKDFKQIDIIIEALKNVLEKHPVFKQYIVLVKYSRDKAINDILSSIADMRIVWGGDSTIDEIRKSSLPSRSGEITFADRYSISVIDSDYYLAMADKKKVARDFYNDTFYSDQNACTSPRIIIWTGNQVTSAKELFWKEEYQIVRQRYQLQPIQAVDKLHSAYLLAMTKRGCKIIQSDDNLIIRVEVPLVSDELIEHFDNSGFFIEYECKEIMDIKVLCNNKRCQTLSYIGNPESFLPLVHSGIKGVDRIVPMGKTMDFDLIWDGYDLFAMLTRIVVVAQ